MSRLWVTGYRSYEIGTFGNEDPKIEILKYALEQELRVLIEQGVDWILTGGQMGTEQWTIEVAYNLKNDYPDLKIALLYPFKGFGDQWQQSSKDKLRLTKKLVDFSDTVSKLPYKNPQQLKNYQIFMLSHTDSALLLYDTEFKGKVYYDYQAILAKQGKSPYPSYLVDMDKLQDYAIAYNEILHDKTQFFE